jgi:Zn-dependent protease
VKVEKCRVCGREAAKRFTIPNIYGEVTEIPVCDQCYARYEPKPSKKGVSFVKARNVSHLFGIVWFIESASIARFIERLGKTLIGRVAASLSMLSIPLTFISIVTSLWLIVDRVLRPGFYLRFASIMPKGYLATGIPGLDPAVPILQGWIAVMILLAVHEFAHGIASTYLGTPPRKAGLILVLGLPMGAYVKIDRSPVERDSWRFIGAGVSANILAASLALLLFALNGVPELYTRYPSLLLLPPEFVEGVMKMKIGISFTQSLLLWIAFMNLWAPLFNCLPIPGLDGYWIFSSILSRATSRLLGEGGRKLGFKISFASGFAMLLGIAIVLIIEKVIIPYF